MKVIDHEPYRWFLLEEPDSLFLDVNCSHGAVDYDFLVQLTPDETREFHQKGKAYLDWLSEEIHYSAPAVRGSNSIYKSRGLQAPYRAQVDAAIKMWAEKGMRT